MMPVGVPHDVTVRLALLSVPVAEGELLTTRIRYPDPPLVVVAIVALMFPAFKVLIKLPMFTGEANEPVLFDNCAV